MDKQQMLTEVKEKVSIQTYFDNVIIPSMGTYYDGETVDFEFKPTCCCPLHNEDTPSFRVYGYSNTYYCFGCGSGGDIIHLHQEFMRINKNRHVSFDDALNGLYNQFVKGKNLNKIVAPSKAWKANKKESSNIEILMYNKSLYDTLQMVQNSKELPIKSKISTYDELDDIDTLVRLQWLNAGDATELVDDKQSEVLQQIGNR